MRDSSHVRWFLFAGCSLLSAVAFLDRVNISIAGSFLAAYVVALIPESYATMVYVAVYTGVRPSELIGLK